MEEKVQKSKSQGLLHLEEKIDFLSQTIRTVEENLELKGKEIDGIQVGLLQPKKWWHASSNIISIVAILISIIATVYSARQDASKELSEQKKRVKEIVKRLTELDNMRFNSYGGYLRFGEESNLVDEAIELSEIDYRLLNDAEYSAVINSALRTNKTENFEKLIEKALKTVNDASSKYSIKNGQADYLFNIKRDTANGRKVMLEVLELTQQQVVSPEIKKINIANELAIWSSNELMADNYLEADTLLIVAENMIYHDKDPWKIENFPIKNDLMQRRQLLDRVLVMKGLKSINPMPPPLFPPTPAVKENKKK